MSEESGARRLTTWPQDGVPRRTTSASEHALLTARSISSTDKAEDDAEGMSPIKGVVTPTRKPRGSLDGDAAAAERAAASQDDRRSVFALVNSVLGAGALGYPFCFKECGLALAVLLVVATLLAAELGMRLLLLSGQIVGRRTYGDVARHALGRPGQAAVELSVGVMSLGSLVAYLNILADTFSTVAGSIIPPGAEPSRNAILVGTTLCGAMPVCLLLRDPHLLGMVSFSSVAFIFLFGATVVALAAAAPVAATELTWWRWEGLLVSFPVVAYSFTAHQTLFSLYTSLKTAGLKRMTSVVQTSMLLSAAVFLVIGAAGFVAFGQRTAGDILRNFGGAPTAGFAPTFERALKVGFGGSVLGTMPLVVGPLVASAAALLGPPAGRTDAAKPSGGGSHGTASKAPRLGGAPSSGGAPDLPPAQEHLLTAAILGASCAVAVLVPNLENVFGLAGSTAAVLVSFVLPPAIFLRCTAEQRGLLGHSVDMLTGSELWRRRRRMAAALLAFGLLAGASSSRAMLSTIAVEKQVVQLAQQLAAEEGKVAQAAGTELAAKQGAEVVSAVSQANKLLEAAQAEALKSAELGASTQGAATATEPGQAAAGEAAQAAGRGRAAALPQGAAGGAAAAAAAGTDDLHLAQLDAVSQEVERTMEVLGAVVDSLGATAAKMRAEMEAAGAQQQQAATAATKPATDPEDAAASAAAAGDVAGGLLAAAATAGQKSGNRAGAGNATAATAGLERAAAVLGAREEARTEARVAAALESVAGVARDALSTLRSSQAALGAARAAADAAGAFGGELSPDEAARLDAASHDALRAASDTALRVNATMAALRALEAQQASELVALVARLAEEESAVEARREAEAHRAAAAAGRGGGTLRSAVRLVKPHLEEGGSVAGAAAAEATESEGRGEQQQGERREEGREQQPRGGGAQEGTAQEQRKEGGTTEGEEGSQLQHQQGQGQQQQQQQQRGEPALPAPPAARRPAPPGASARDALKQISGAAPGAVVNATEVARAAVDVASSAAQSARASVEQAIDAKDSEVAMRAIEIAKELAASDRGGSGGNRTSVLHHVANSIVKKDRNKDKAAAQQQQQQPAAGGNQTAVAAQQQQQQQQPAD